MGQSYALNKVHIYNHRKNNREKYNEYQRKLCYNIRNNPNYAYEQISKIFRNILL